MRYRIVTASGVEDLEIEVNKVLDEYPELEPFGSVFSLDYGFCFQLSQTLRVKKKLVDTLHGCVGQ